jgi:tetratricopeptide (TPR) repeat protein
VSTPDDPVLAALAARIAAGESIDADALPEPLRQREDVQRLLRFARVVDALASNADATPPDAPPSDAPPPAPARIGVWRLVRPLGAGGMGEVWLGERDDGTVEHRVALKRVRGTSPMFAARLQEERRILARLEHPNIARFIDAGVGADGEPWLALEYVDGEPLHRWCERERPSLRARLQLFLKICDAVGHAHRRLVVHRDLKPGNVLVDRAGEPRLLDFGIAKLLDAERDHTTQLAITPAYAAPEQLRGEEVSTVTDVYALGLLLFRLLAGALPETRRDASLAAVLVQLDREETQRPSRAHAGAALPYPPAALAGDLDAIVSKAIRALPEARYASAHALREDVQRHLDARPVLARALTRRYLLARFVRRNRLAAALGLAAVLALLLGTVVATWQARRAEDAAAAQAREAARADREAQAARAQAQRATRASQFVLSVFQQSDLLRRDGRGAISIDEAFEDALARIDRDFGDDAMLAADLNDDFGELLASKGRFEEAIARLQRALALAEQAHGADSVAVAETLVNLAVVESYRGLPLQGRAAVERAIAILERDPVADPALLGNARMTYAGVLMNADEMARGLEQMHEGVRLYRAHLPGDDPRLAVALFNLGAALYSEARWSDAEPLLEEALARTERAQGADSAALLPIFDFLGTNRDHLGRHAEAEATVRRALAIADAAYGDAPHPHRAMPRMELGYHQLRRGELAEARAAIDAGRAMLREVGSPQELFGPCWIARGAQRCAALDGATLSRCLELRAYALQARSRIAGATPALADAEQLIAENISTHAGGDAPIEAQRARAEILVALGRRDEAQQAYREVVSALTRRYVPEHRDVALATSRLAEIGELTPR